MKDDSVPKPANAIAATPFHPSYYTINYLTINTHILILIY